MSTIQKEKKPSKKNLLIKNTPDLKTKSINIINAQQNNLKNISVSIPRNKFVVVTGVSGSGKSSLAFDTLYAEGQRRFVESLSSYARQFLERMQKPDVETIEGLPPAIAIEQLPPSKNPRSTVGTTTEIYDYLRLLYGRIGKTYCHNCGKLIKKDSPNSITDTLINDCLNEKIYIMFQIPENITDTANYISYLKENGFYRAVENESDLLIDLNENTDYIFHKNHSFFLADRLIIKSDKENRTRLFESIENALNFGKGRIFVKNLKNSNYLYFSNIYECNVCRILYQEPEPRLFSFNNPYGACHHCQGFGKTMDIDENIVIPDKSISIRKNAVAPFKSQSYFSYQLDLLKACELNNIDIEKAYIDLTDKEKDIVWNGIDGYEGIYGFFKELELKNYKVQNRVMLSRYKGYTNCKHCHGSRLRTSARQVFIDNHNVPILIKKPLHYLKNFFDNLTLNEHDHSVADLILNELRWRITLLVDIGLDYLSLERLTHTLSGGESQRINLSTALGSSLVGTLYVLDEPSIGLHQSDTLKLIKILKKIRNIGNTVVVVEHDPEIMTKADFIIDVGPEAGVKGGHLVYAGSVDEIVNCKKSITGQYLSGAKKIIHSKNQRKIGDNFIKIIGAKENNLKIDEVKIPLGVMTVVSGVSGSGKSTLINDILYAGLKRIKNNYNGFVGAFKAIEGYQHISDVMLVDQTPIGKSSRSTPATYTKIFDNIRELFADTQAAKQMSYRPGHFSFNTPGGRCEVCEGEGYITVDMQFLPNISLICETCKGTRYSREIKNIQYKGKSIIDVLNMTVDEALAFFHESRKISAKLLVLHDIGLGYIKLGQSSSNLSGGEAQRIKIAEFLDSSVIANNLIIFDEPTTGLHLDDISKLLKCFNKLVDKGNTIVIIEHNLNVIADADWVLDLGPGAGENGGEIVVIGTPQKVMDSKKSLTGVALRESGILG